VETIARQVDQAEQREEFLSILRRVGSDATAVRQTLESNWSGEYPPSSTEGRPPEAPLAVSPTQAPLSEADSERLAKLESGVAELTQLLKTQSADQNVKDWYSTKEVAERTASGEWTIRQACNKGRISADKGPDGKWRIHHSELEKIKKHGLPK
jgi:hypothetical protein